MKSILLAASAVVMAGCAAKPPIKPAAAANPPAETSASLLSDEPLSKKAGQPAPATPAPSGTPVPVVSAGRYRTQMATPAPGQEDLLGIIIDIHFPSQVTRVGDAVRWLLIRSGWRWEEVSTDGPLPVMTAPLPEAHRHLGPLTLRQALKVLAGGEYTLYEDPRRRVLWYRLRNTL